jgi:N-acetylglucosaminyl-diphospho-decaprenol L-rhamnosyltransferase
MMARSKPGYGVVVVSFGSGEVLNAFLGSLALSTLVPEAVVVVENGPKPPGLSDYPFSVAVIHLPENPGYGTAVNVGVHSLPQPIPWVLVSNPDVTLDSDAIATLLVTAGSFPDAGSLGPALINTDGTTYPSARAIPGLSMGIGHGIFGLLWRNNPWTLAYKGDYSAPHPRLCGWLSGACLVVRREAFAEIGGFDTNYFMFMEDVDLGMRLTNAGWSNIYVPEARAIHSVGHSTSNARVNMIRAHHHSAKRFVSKRYPGLRWAPIRLLVNVGLSLRSRIAQVVREVSL